jgi:hypothetical protein
MTDVKKIRNRPLRRERDSYNKFKIFILNISVNHLPEDYCKDDSERGDEDQQRKMLPKFECNSVVLISLAGTSSIKF